MDIIAERKPVSNDDWVAVANYYQEWSEEATVRKSTGVKRYFYEVLCEKNKKGTGTSTLAERTRRAQSIHRDILAKEAAQSMGLMKISLVTMKVTMMIISKRMVMILQTLLEKLFLHQRMHQLQGNAKVHQHRSSKSQRILDHPILNVLMWKCNLRTHPIH